MPAEVLVLLASFPDKKEQVAISRLNVQDFHLGGSTGAGDDLEELTVPIRPHVERYLAAGTGPTWRAIPYFQAGSDPCELAHQNISVHGIISRFTDTIDRE
jgi:hypothetical protein